MHFIKCCVQQTPLVPNYPLYYSLQSRSRESVSYTDAPAHLRHSDKKKKKTCLQASPLDLDTSLVPGQVLNINELI